MCERKRPRMFLRRFPETFSLSALVPGLVSMFRKCSCSRERIGLRKQSGAKFAENKQFCQMSVTLTAGCTGRMCEEKASNLKRLVVRQLLEMCLANDAQESLCEEIENTNTTEDEEPFTNVGNNRRRTDWKPAASARCIGKDPRHLHGNNPGVQDEGEMKREMLETTGGGRTGNPQPQRDASAKIRVTCTETILASRMKAK
ncbi:hypothetical protein F2P81_018938 [Scophthalmus maximus]|uniref:Uncharacterized protein n=1 Tax=Scophthalmus maximus TaxID=52904 RepID=A0A6A4S603_SCOMX|nr:hypothetical protein F2P81_018938 [Scophthalmus maximus]